jgi:carbon-monoxide dehydrogenase medium subunit
LKSAPFEYHRPESVSEALALLSEFENARVLAGGQSLIAMMNMRYAQVGHLVDLNRISDLADIRRNGDALHVGAMVRQRVLLTSPLMKEHSPLLIEALSNVGHIQTRSRGTIGGSLCHLDPAAELPATLLALDAHVILRRADGERRVDIDDWFQGFMTPNLQPGEILTEICIPRATDSCGYAFLEVSRRKGDFALGGVACLVKVQDKKISNAVVTVMGLGVRPQRLNAGEAKMIGEVPTPALFNAVADRIEDVEILGDHYSDRSYKITLGKTLVSRALKKAVERAAGHHHE